MGWSGHCINQELVVGIRLERSSPGFNELALKIFTFAKNNNNNDDNVGDDLFNIEIAW